MVVIARRALLAGAGAIAAGSLAATLTLRKPPPHIYTLADAPEPKPFDMSALVATLPPAPRGDLGFTDQSGAQHRLAEFAGKGVVLNLWATWCGPCVEELPSLARLARLVAGEGIVVVALSTDRGGAATVQRFFADHAITGLEVRLDPQSATAEALGLRGLPTTLLLDPQGRERARLEGGADWSTPDALAAVRRHTLQAGA